MITQKTQRAILVLKDISGQFSITFLKPAAIPYEELADILFKLRKGHLIQLKSPGDPPDVISSYLLTRPLRSTSLLDVLECLNETLNCTRPISERMYDLFPRVANRLGIVNMVTRTYLSNIDLTDF